MESYAMKHLSETTLHLSISLSTTIKVIRKKIRQGKNVNNNNQPLRIILKNRTEAAESLIWV